jgi:hypothetical protein
MLLDEYESVIHKTIYHLSITPYPKPGYVISTDL